MHRDLRLENLYIKLVNKDDQTDISTVSLNVEPFCIKIASFGKSKLLGHNDRTDSVHA